MAIINTFDRCLDSPYLVADPTAIGEAQALLSKGGERIALAELINSPDSLEISDLSHESMFLTLRALLYAKGYREAGLKCLLVALGTLYVKPGLLDPSHFRAFEAARGLKAPPIVNLNAAKALHTAATALLAVDPKRVTEQTLR